MARGGNATTYLVEESTKKKDKTPLCVSRLHHCITA
jgi:hypothetical protein